jgi:nucleotide-binding universal stress UspA family protein
MSNQYTYSLFLSNEDLVSFILTQDQQQISKILVPIDGSENSMEAADYAVKMAEKYGALVTAIHVVNIDQNLQLLGIHRLSYPEPIRNKIEELRAEVKAWFGEITKKAEMRNVRVKTEIIEDSPMSVVSTIVNYADEGKLDLIVIGTRGRSGISKMLLGSVATGVVSYAPCPVVVLK